MRAIYLSDLHVAACALRKVSATARPAAMATAVAQAEAADQYRKRFRKAHPRFGSGTLAGAFGNVQEPPRCDRAYLEALGVVIATLRDREHH